MALLVQRDLKRKEVAIEEYSRAEEARKQQAAVRRLRYPPTTHGPPVSTSMAHIPLMIELDVNMPTGGFKL